MSILVTCLACGTRLNAPDAAAGKTGPCPKCGAPIAVPAIDPSTLPEAIEETAQPGPAAPVPTATAEVYLDDEDAAPPKKTRRRNKKRSDRVQLAIGVGLALAGVAVTVVMALVIRPWEKPANQQAANADSGAAQKELTKGVPPKPPVDPEKLPPHRASVRKHFLETVLPVYDSLHPQAAPGRDEGRRGLEAYGLYLAHGSRSDLLIDYVKREIDRAIVNGCKDVLVEYAACRLALDAGGPDEIWDKVVDLAERDDLAKYPAVRRMHVLYNAAASCPDMHSIPMKERIERSKQLEEDFWKVFAEAAADRNPHSEEELLGVARILLGRQDALGGDRHANYQRARDILAQAGARESVRLTLDGTYHFHTASFLLGGDPTLAGPAERAAAREPFERARTALEKAWTLDPEGPIAPTYMMTVVFETEQKWEPVEPWFVRAMKANPDNAWACGVKAGCLSPSRGGSAEEELEFARWCIQTENWEGGIPQAALTAYLTLVSQQPGFFNSAEHWNEVTSFFRAWQAAQPNSRIALTEHARMAALTGHYDEAISVFDRIEERPWHEIVPDPTAYRRLVFRTYAAIGQLPNRPLRAPARAPGAVGRILKHKDRWEAPRAARRDGFVRLAHGAYEQAHVASAKGYAEGAAALTAVAEALSIGYPHGRHMDVAWTALDKAVAAGCDDPLVHSLHVRFGLATGQVIQSEEVADRYRKSLDSLLASDYPAALQLPALLEGVLIEAGTGDKETLGKRLEAFWTLFTAAAADRSPYAQRVAIQSAEGLLEVEGVESLRHESVHGKLKRALEEAKADPYAGLVIDGIHLTSAAWDARGGAPGAEVARDQMAIFKARLREAEQALSRAWRLDPTRSEAPARMITVCMGLEHSWPETERWFARAVDADPAESWAYRRLALYLEPKWYGAAGGFDLLYFRTLAFECGRWKEGLGTIAHDAELTARLQYMGMPLTNPSTWAEIEHTLKTWVAAEPDCRYAKTIYALAAAQARQLETADKLFRELGDKPWPGVFPTRETYLQLAEAVAREVRGRRVD